mgnify:CR=1 FL=1
MRVIFENAIVRETAAHHKYLQLAKFAKSNILKKIFETLAAEELTHKELFSKMDLTVLKIVSKTNLTTLNLLNEYEDKLDITDMQDIKNAIDLAIKEEEQAYQDYSTLIKYLDFGPGRESLQEIAKQELAHKHILQKTKQKLENNWKNSFDIS